LATRIHSSRSTTTTRAACLALALLVLAPSFGATARAAETRYVLHLRGEPSADVGSSFDGARVVAVNAPIQRVSVVSTDPSFPQRAAADPRVESVEAAPTLTLLLDEAATPVAPNDPSFADQEGLAQIHAGLAWATAGFGDAANASLCVVDTGVRYTHEDLNGTRWMGGHDFVNGDDDPMDDNGHGTHVSGIAAATVDNGLGIAGVANVSLYGVKVLDFAGMGSMDVIAQGVTWCVGHTPPRTVISMSLGGEADSSALDDAVAYAAAHGKLVVAASGNEGCNDCVLFPARLPDVIAVSCVDGSDLPCSFSSKGPQVAIAAPGEGVLSTWDGDDSSYASLSGTSMSTAFVSGSLALAWSANPDLTAAQLRARLLATARDVGARGHDDATGAGVLDADCLVRDAAPCGDAPFQPACGMVNDTFGYACEETPFAPRALPSNATLVHLGDEGLSEPIPLGFSFSFYGEAHDHAYLSPNGYLTFQDDETAGCCAGQEVPDANAPNDLVAGHWGDLDPGLAGAVRYATLGSAPEREFVAEWSGVPNPDGAAPSTFQVILHESSDIIETQVVDAPSDGRVHVTGIESPEGSSGLRALYGADALHHAATLFLPGDHLSEAQNLTAVPGSEPGSVQLNWTAPRTLGEGLAGYRLYRGTAEGYENRYVASLGADATGYQDEGLDAHARYHYRLVAYGEPGDAPGALAASLSAGDLAPCETATDAAGYSCATTDFRWVDATGGVPLPLEDDVLSTLVPIGFNFTFYGQTHDSLYVGSNGFLAFDPGTSQGCCNGQAIPGSYLHDVIAGDWEDLYAPGEGTIHVATLGQAPERSFVVSWEGVSQFYHREPVTFEIILHEGTNQVEVQSADVPSDGSHLRTVGIEDPSGAIGLSYRHGLFGLADAGILFTPPNATPPDAPTGLSLTPSEQGGASLSWSAPEGDGGAAILGYDLFRSTPCEGDVLVAQVGKPGASDPAFDASLPATYSVAARNAAGEGPRASLAYEPSPDATVPPCVRLDLDPATPDGHEGVYTSPVHVTLAPVAGTGALNLSTLAYRVDDGDWVQGDNLTLPEGWHDVEAVVLDENGTQSPVAERSVRIDLTRPTVRLDRFDQGGFEDAALAHARAKDASVRAEAVSYEVDLEFSEGMSEYAVGSALRGLDGWHLVWYDEGYLALERRDGWTTPPPVVVGTGASDLAGNRLAAPFAFTPLGPAVQTTLSLPAPDGAAGWYVHAPNATLTATPDNARITYRLDGSDDIIYDGPFAIPAGVHELTYNATADGLPDETPHAVEIRVDDQAPILGNLSVSPALPRPGDDIAFSLPVSDPLSGVAGVSLRVGDAALPTTFDGRFANATLHAAPAGALTLRAHAVDAAGNARDADAGTVDVQSPPAPPPPRPPPPTPARHAPGAPGAPSVTVADGHVLVAWAPPGDAGSPPLTSYHLYRRASEGRALLATVSGTSFDDATARPGGTYAYSVAAVNDVGEGSSSPESTATLPALPSPTSHATISPASPDGGEGWYVSSPSVALNASSGASLLWRLDGGSDQAYSGPIAIPAGRHTLHWHATQTGAPDEAEHAQDFQVDLAPPSLDGASLSAPNATVGHGVTLTVRAHDDASGVASVRALLSDGTSVDLSPAGGSFVGTLSPRAAGSYSVSLVARDHAGHETSGSGGSFRMDAPLATAQNDNATAPTSPTARPPSTPAPSGNSGSPSSGGGQPLEQASVTPTPASASPSSPPPAPQLVVTQDANATASLDAGARGQVHVSLRNAPHPDRVRFVVIDEQGHETTLGGGSDATWDTTQQDDGHYTVEARERQPDGHEVVLASTSVLVRNSAYTAAAAAGGAALGVGAAALATVATNTLTTSAMGAATATASSSVSSAAGSAVTSGGGSSGFSFTQYLKDLFTDAGSDALRDRTKDLASIERRRRIASAIALVLTVSLIAVFYTIAEAGAYTWAAFVATLPFVGVAAVLLALQKYGSESLIAHLSGARVRFRIWVAGVASLLVSTIAFRSPFGYPGYVDNGVEETEGEKRLAGHRALAILGITSAWSLVFLVAGRLGFYTLESVGVAMAVSALATAAMPFGPLPGGEVWRWSKPVSLAAAAAAMALYVTYEMALLPQAVLVGVGVVGASGYAFAALRFRREHRRPPRRVPVEDVDAQRAAKHEAHREA